MSLSPLHRLRFIVSEDDSGGGGSNNDADGQEPNGADDEGKQQDSETDEAGKADDGDDGDSDGKADDEAPKTGLTGEALQKELDRVRSENAQRRQNEKALKEQLAEAVTKEDFERIVGEYETKVKELERTAALSRFEDKLPADALELLSDIEDAEALKAKGDKLVQLLAKGGRSAHDADDLNGGLDPHDGGDDEPSTPAEMREWRKTKRRR